MPDQNSHDVGIETLKKMKALTESAYARTGDDSWRMPWIDKWIIRQLQIAALKEIERKAIETKNHHGNPGTHESQREFTRFKALEFKYRQLGFVPDFLFATHGAKPEHMIEILKRGTIHATPENPSGLSLDATAWGPGNVFLIFPFNSVKNLLVPVFYTRERTFTEPVDGFYICSWDAIFFTELALEGDIPVNLAAYMLIPPPLKNIEVERLAMEKNLIVKSQFQTELSRWAEMANAFSKDFHRVIGYVRTTEYLPFFILNYDKKLADVYGIPWRKVEDNADVIPEKNSDIPENPGTHEFQREAKRKEWGGRGYPPALIERGLSWAEEYSNGMAAKITEDPALRHRIIQELYPRSLDMADNWIQGLWKVLS